LLNIEDNYRIKYRLPVIKQKDIRTVYFKTGIFYQKDEKVNADIVLRGPDLYKMINAYEGCSEILDDYIRELKSRLDWYSDIKQKYEAGNVEETLGKDYGQTLLLKDIFSESVEINQGTSRGRPWANTNILRIQYGETLCDSENIFMLFVRVDRNVKGYYISYRQYERYDKNNNIKAGGESGKANEKQLEERKERKKCYYIRIKNCFNFVHNQYPELLACVRGDVGKYFESEIGYFLLGNDAKKNALNHEFLSVLRRFNKKFMDCIVKEFGKEKVEILL